MVVKTVTRSIIYLVKYIFKTSLKYISHYIYLSIIINLKFNIVTRSILLFYTENFGRIHSTIFKIKSVTIS